MVPLEEAMRGSIRSISLRRAVGCDACKGHGEIRGKRCPTCGGAGRVTRTEAHQVKIPAGITEGKRLRVGGKGEGGSGGGGAGDLLLTVRLGGHPDFRVEGSNLSYDLDLAPWEAVLGAQVTVPTLDGALSIKIPPGTQGGQRLRVRGRGLGLEADRGDLYVVARVLVPATVSDSERKAWEELARQSAFKPRE